MRGGRILWALFTAGAMALSGSGTWASSGPRSQSVALRNLGTVRTGCSAQNQGATGDAVHRGASSPSLESVAQHVSTVSAETALPVNSEPVHVSAQHPRRRMLIAHPLQGFAAPPADAEPAAVVGMPVVGPNGPMKFTHQGGHHIMGALLMAAANYLGMSQGDLLTKLHGGQSLAQVAEASNKSVAGLEAVLTAVAAQKIHQLVQTPWHTRTALGPGIELPLNPARAR